MRGASQKHQEVNCLGESVCYVEKYVLFYTSDTASSVHTVTAFQSLYIENTLHLSQYLCHQVS